jgi:hypothetical protein
MAMTAEEKKKRRAELRYDKIHKAYESAKGTMTRIWTEALTNMDTHETILKKRSDLMSSGTWEAMDSYNSAKCMGISDVLSDLLWKELVWTHVLDGKRVLSKSFPDDRIRDIDTDESAHCYVSPEGKLVPFREKHRNQDKEAGRL